MYTVKKKWLTGWVCLPCFTVEVFDGDGDYGADLTCNAILSEIFLIFFAPYWSGKVHITGSYEEGQSQ